MHKILVAYSSWNNVDWYEGWGEIWMNKGEAGMRHNRTMMIIDQGACDQ